MNDEGVELGGSCETEAAAGNRGMRTYAGEVVVSWKNHL